MAGPAEVDLSGTTLYRRLLGYVKPHWPALLIAVIGLALVALTEAGFAAWLKPTLDSLFVEPDPERARLVPLWLIGIFLLRGVASFAASYGMAWVGRRVIRQLRGEMFDRLLHMPGAFFDRTPAGGVISRLTFDVEQVANASTNALTILVRDTLTVVFLLAYMFWLSPLLASLFLVAGPVIGLLVRYVSGRFRRISRRIQDNMGEVTQRVQEVVDGQQVVKSFGGQQREQERFDGVNRRNFQLQMKRTATSAASVPVVQLIAAATLAVIIYLASSEAVLQQVTVSDFVSFIAAMLLLMPPIKRLTRVTQSIQTGIAAAGSIFGLLDTKVEPDSGQRELEGVDGRIEYRDISLAYPGSEARVLRDISFHIRPGQTVALVGRSGSGKSSVARLLSRFYNPSAGTVAINGHDIREYRLGSLRRQIATVSQDVLLFHDTIRANIAYGSSEEPTDEQILEAARSAHALEFIEQLPGQLDAVVGERGVLLSGGQRQRIAIARALLKNAPVLVLDEATAALDTESERVIQDALQTLMRNRTTLVIAHRLSTVERADRILVLEGGEVVESGTHAGLLALDGQYAALYRMQFRDHEVPVQ